MIRSLPFIILFIISSSLLAETILFKDRTVRKGKVVNQTINTILFKDSSGEEVSVEKIKVLKVMYKDISDEEADQIFDREFPGTKATPPQKQKQEKQEPAKETKSDGSQIVYLKDNQSIKIKISSQDANALYYLDENEEKQSILKSQVSRVVYNSGVNENNASESEKGNENSEAKEDPSARNTVLSEADKTESEIKPTSPAEVDINTQKTEIEQRNKWSIVWRSALIPGWGQWKTGQKGIGAVAFTGFLGTFAFAHSASASALATKSSYFGTSNFLLLAGPTLTTAIPGYSPLGVSVLYNVSAYHGYASKVATYNNAIAGLGAIYVLQLLHAYLAGKNWEKEQTPVTTLGGNSYRNGFNFNTYKSNNYGMVEKNYELSIAVTF